jgi:hypothetical protein
VAIYHLSTKPIGVARSAVAAAAYRSGVDMEDRNTGEVHEYSRRTGILREDGGIVVPEGSPEWARDSQELWNRAQDASRNKDGAMRKNARYAREWEVSLPHELNREQRKELGYELARELCDRYKVPVQIDFHAPGKEGDNRNWHIHIMVPTHELGPDGFGRKAAMERADRDLKKEGLPSGRQQLKDIRKEWADMANRSLERAGHEERIDHRSLKSRYTEAMERGDYEAAEKFKREPTKHMGPAVTSMERGKPLYRGGKEVEGEWFKAPQKTEIGDANRRIEFAAELGKIQREKASVGRSIIDTESSIGEALKERNGQFRDFLKSQRDNAGSRGTEKPPERTDWSHMRELAGSRGTERKNEREATPESIDAAIRGYAAQTGQQAPRNSLQERFGHLTKGQAPTEPEKRLEGPQREREAPQIITDPERGTDAAPIPCRSLRPLGQRPAEARSRNPPHPAGTDGRINHPTKGENDGSRSKRPAGQPGRRRSPAPHGAAAPRGTQAGAGTAPRIAAAGAAEPTPTDRRADGGPAHGAGAPEAAGARAQRPGFEPVTWHQWTARCRQPLMPCRPLLKG